MKIFRSFIFFKKMNEIITNPEFLSGELLSSGVQAIGGGILAEVQQTVPELVVHVQNIGSGAIFVSSLAEYLPFLSSYSDQELLIFVLVSLFWLLCVVWVLRDASARSESVGYQLFSTLLVVLLSPIIGLPLYLAFRPLTYKWERGFWREALEQKLVLCPHCQGLNSVQHKMCAWCGEALQVECKQCHCSYQGQFAYCPECGAPNIE